MQVLLTGATGFVGSHLARLLVERGCEVRCLVREESSLEALDANSVELCYGDLRDAAAVERAMRGARWVFHCAADYRLYARRSRELYETNVDGSRNVCAAAARTDIERLVYTSTVGALGKRSDGSPADEQTPVTIEQMVGHYKRSKFLAECEVASWIERGLPVVMVHPSTPVGEADRKPTPTGQMVLDFLRGKVPAYVRTGLNLIDVRDVAVGHWQAAENGVIGRRYILGHENLSLQQIYVSLAEIAGLPAPKIRLPFWLPLVAAAASTGWARLTGGVPAVPLEAVRMAATPMYFDAGRAVAELGLPQSPVREALRRSVDWYRDNGRV